MTQELHSNIEAAVAFNPAAITTNTTTSGPVIDLQGFATAEFVVLTGTVTDGTYQVNLQEGDQANGSDMADAAADRLLGTEPSFVSTDDNAAKRVGLRMGTKRYARLQIVSTGVTTGVNHVSAVCLKGAPAFKPRP
jgi:hypothetical protein